MKQYKRNEDINEHPSAHKPRRQKGNWLVEFYSEFLSEWCTLKRCIDEESAKNFLEKERRSIFGQRKDFDKTWRIRMK